MKIVLTLGIACVLGLSAQTQAPPSAPAAAKPQSETSAAPEVQKAPVVQVKPGEYKMDIPVVKSIPLMQLPANFVVATVNGEKVTAGQLQSILRVLPPQLVQQAESNRKELVIQYGTLMRLVDMARKEKLDQQSPYKEQIEYQTIMLLQSAIQEQKKRTLQVSQEDVKKFYDSHPDQFAEVTFKAIYLPFNTSATSQADATGKPLPTEAEAKAKAEDLVKQARAGADFVKLVKENSGDPTSVAKNGDFPAIKKSDQSIPADIRKVLFSLKKDEVSDPVPQSKGFYIFRVVTTGAQPLDQVQGVITEEVRSQQMNTWLADLKKGIDVKMEDEPAPSAAATVPSASVAPVQK